MIEKLREWDESLFLWLNAQRLDVLDPVMNTLTGRYIWIPLYLLIIFMLIRTYGQTGVWYTGGLLLLIFLADQSTSSVMKPYFERLRPCHDPRWEGMINNYSGCGGMYGFASSHASNTFALAMYLWLIGREKLPLFSWMFLWAAIISYTRVYLGVHYPADILVGAMVGMLAGLITYYAISFMMIKARREKVES
ncbi:phosphatase PAP2 family protein [Pleomorphovibrio marinus]|uniref:phosphatase PAP2 family protein n=1 Tax=Pleomorphovibrio marinus TaxID=2164132 RepID=UPI000E0AB851|nr:phosphatase PAP2 family protein [Pleomorphovibrio marinus]